MKFFIVLFLMVFGWIVPTYADENTTIDDEEIISYAEKRRQERLNKLNDAQIFEQQMLERRAQKAKRKKTKRISGSSRVSSSSKTATSSSKKTEQSSSKKGLSGSSGIPSLASGMFVK